MREDRHASASTPDSELLLTRDPPLPRASDAAAFRGWYERTLTQLCLQDDLPREPHWSEAFAVGSRRWLAGLAGGDPQVEEHIRPLEGRPETDQEAMCMLNPPRSIYRRIWSSLLTGNHR